MYSLVNFTLSKLRLTVSFLDTEFSRVVQYSGGGEGPPREAPWCLQLW